MLESNESKSWINLKSHWFWEPFVLPVAGYSRLQSPAQGVCWAVCPSSTVCTSRSPPHPHPYPDRASPVNVLALLVSIVYLPPFLMLHNTCSTALECCLTCHDLHATPVSVNIQHDTKSSRLLICSTPNIAVRWPVRAEKGIIRKI